MAGTVVDLFLVYQFLRRLTTPFNEWKAYQLGIIDERGNILKKRSKLSTIEERNAFRIFDVMVLKLKKLLEKVPGGKSRLASYAAALYLIKEYKEDMNENDVSILVENSVKEEIANAVGGGHIAGIGVGPNGEPGVTKKKQKEYTDKNKKKAAGLFKRIKKMGIV